MLADKLIREERAEVALGWAVVGGDYNYAYGTGRPENAETLLVQYGNKNLTFEDLEAVA